MRPAEDRVIVNRGDDYAEVDATVTHRGDHVHDGQQQQQQHQRHAVHGRQPMTLRRKAYQRASRGSTVTHEPAGVPAGSWIVYPSDCAFSRPFP